MRVAPHDEVISISWDFARAPWETRLRVFRLCPRASVHCVPLYNMARSSRICSSTTVDDSDDLDAAPQMSIAHQLEAELDELERTDSDSDDLRALRDHKDINNNRDAMQDDEQEEQDAEEDDEEDEEDEEDEIVQEPPPRRRAAHTATKKKAAPSEPGA
jgi:hypothetical protein